MTHPSKMTKEEQREFARELINQTAGKLYKLDPDNFGNLGIHELAEQLDDILAEWEDTVECEDEDY